MTETLVGTMFKLNRPMLGCKAGDIGYVFEEYQDFDNSDLKGVQIIFANGEHDGFSAFEQKEYLEKVGFKTEYKNYEFVNVWVVSQDFSKGYWKW